MRLKFFFGMLLLGTMMTAVGQTTEQPKIKVVQIQDSIYMLQGRGGNIGLSLGEDGVMMIDNQFAESTPDILNALLTLTNNPVKFLVNTHMHGDHSGGNANMAQQGATIFAHENVRQRMIGNAQQQKENAINEATKKNLENMEARTNDSNRAEVGDKARRMAVSEVGLEGPDKYKLPTVTFSDDMTFYFNGEKVMVLHNHKAHTDGDALVYFTGSNVLHTGDLFFKDRYPFIDLKNGGDIQGYIRSLNQMLMLIDDETKVIPGHGDVATKEDVNKLKRMMEWVRDRITVLYLGGATAAELKNMPDILETYDAQGFGDYYIKSDKFLGMMVDYIESRYRSKRRK